jgi:glycosyltransferase involved in cell wall biosynthesis
MLIPVALLEAMARWTICFVSDLPNLKILVSDKKNAVIFKKDDIVDLKEKIKKYIDNESISKWAYQFWKDFSDYKEIWDKYINLLNSI